MPALYFPAEVFEVWNKLGTLVRASGHAAHAGLNSDLKHYSGECLGSSISTCACVITVSH
jgi:hypothetical protein